MAMGEGNAVMPWQAPSEAFVARSCRWWRLKSYRD